MRVRERVGWVANTSLFVVVIVAVIIYALLMSYAARKIPPLGTWLLAPALSALLVGFLASSYAAGQLAGACPEESSAFPLDRFLYVALWGFVMTLIVFSLLSVGKWYHREKRMRVATE